MTARARLVGGVLALATMLVGCVGATPTDDRAGMDARIGDSSRPRVVATTAVLGDVVGAVGGEAIALTVLIPPGVDPHAFEPAPADAMALEDADLIFVNGFDLEESLLPLLDERVAAGARVVSASAGIAARVPGGGSCDEAEGSEDHEAEDAAHGHRDEPCAPDPHVWLDPTNVARWAATIAEHLSVVDPARAGDYAARAAEVEARMRVLDAWIRTRIATVPAERRRFVADHAAYGWFADRYGLEMVGAVLPGFSTLAGASAGELAALQDSIAALDVPAIFVTLAVADDLAARLAADTGVRVVPLYTGSLSEPDGPAASYEAMMRHDVTLMVAALGGDVVERLRGPIVLELSDLCVRFGRRVALDSLSLAVCAGDRVAVVGPNGAGKSTLFHTIIGLVEPTAGSVVVHGHAAGHDTCVAFVPQQSEVDWSYPLTVRDVVMMGRTAHIGLLRLPRAEDRGRVEESLRALRLQDLATRRIGALSGGQRQRMFIARALAQDAHLVLLDEPFRGLDAPSVDDAFEALDLLDARGVAVMLATHDLRLAAERFERLLLLNGRLVAWGPPREVVTDANLLAAYGAHVRLLDTGREHLLVGDMGGHPSAVGGGPPVPPAEHGSAP